MNNRSVQYGLIAAFIGIIVSVISYLFFPDQLGNPKSIPSVLNILFFIAWIYFMAKAAIDFKADNGGYATFKEALKESFIVGAVSSVVMFLASMLMQYVLFSDVYKRVQENAITKMVTKLEEQGQSEEVIEQSIQFAEKSQSMGVWFTLPFFLILAFIICLVIAAIVKKKRPDGI